MPRGAGAAVREIDDLALARPVDGRVRFLDEAFRPSDMPMVAARLPLLAVHALLHHRPLAVVGDDEAVQIEIESVLHGGAVDLGDEPAGARQRRAVEADAFAERRQLLRRAARMLAAAAADVDAKLACKGARPRLSAPITLVVMPDECQSIPITAPNDWNQNGCASRRRNSSRP